VPVSWALGTSSFNVAAKAEAAAAIAKTAIIDFFIFILFF